MKVFACPEGFEEPVPNYREYDYKAEVEAIEAHKARLAQHLRDMGYTGKYTGRVAAFGVADGYAEYMLADGKGRYGSSFLIHLKYGDGYQYRGIEYFPKSAIIKSLRPVR